MSDTPNSGIIQTYAAVTLLSTAVTTVATGSFLYALLICPWMGLFAAILLNELSPGYTMDPWVDFRNRGGRQ